MPKAPGSTTAAAPAAVGHARGAGGGDAAGEKAAGTGRAAGFVWRHFEAWCRGAKADSLPASGATVAAYLAHLADAGLKASTIGRKVAAIAYAHRLAGVDPPTASEGVHAVLRGIRRRVGVAPARKAPATAHA